MFKVLSIYWLEEPEKSGNFCFKIREMAKIPEKDSKFDTKVSVATLKGYYTK